MTKNSDYGGSAREAEDARRTHEFLNRRGRLVIREEPDKIVLSIAPIEESREIDSSDEVGSGD